MKIEDLELLNIERRRAYYRVGLAIESGELERPDRCERCGYECEVEAHHEDYGDPLKVIFLCPRCHKAAHRDARKRLYKREKETATA